MRAELILTGTRPSWVGFQATLHCQARARLDDLDADSYASRLVQRRLLSLHASALWRDTEAAATVTLTTAGYYAAVSDAVDILEMLARAHGLRIQARLEPAEGDAQARAEDALSGLIEID